MPLIIERNNLTAMEVDAVVLPANPWLEEGPGASRAIYKAAGADDLAEACQKFGYVDYGKVVMTDGYALPARYIIHAVVPFWKEEDEAVPKQLYKCYMESLMLAARSGLTSIAFPLLSSGSFRCPKAEALRIANIAIADFFSLEKPADDARDIVRSLSTEPADMMVYLVVYDKESVESVAELYGDIKEYIDDRYVEEKLESDKGCGGEEQRREMMMQPLPDFSIEPMAPMGSSSTVRESRFTLRMPSFKSVAEEPVELESSAEKVADSITDAELDELIERQTETFNDALIRFVNASGMTNPEIYNRANISKQQFSRIISGKGYTPKKGTIFALAMGLKLNMKDTEYLLMKAGYAFSDSSKRDIIVRYFIDRGVFSVIEVNMMLFQFDEALIGSVTA